MPGPERPAVFLDRDGTVMEDVGYPRDPDAVRLLPGAAAALRELHEAGFALVIVSNQSGLARGIITAEQARAVHERFVALLAAEAVAIDAYRYCPHGPDAGCACRKPAPGMLLDAARELGVDLTRSVMIGDRASDLEAGRAAGCPTTILITDTTWSQIAAGLQEVSAR
jgi:histidinol-phosphate phosphatase family protein